MQRNLPNVVVQGNLKNMRTWKIGILACFSSIAFAQFNKSDVDDLKADLLNYANSSCANENYLKLATDLMSKMSYPISNNMTSEQAKSNDQLRAATSGIRDAMMASMLGNKTSCAQKLRDGIKSIDALPIKSVEAKPPVNEPTGDAAR